MLASKRTVGLLVDQQDHPLFITVEGEERRVHRHRVAQWLGGEAELTRLRARGEEPATARVSFGSYRCAYA